MGNVEEARPTKLGTFSLLELKRDYFAWPRGQSIEVLQCKGLPFNHFKSR